MDRLIEAIEDKQNPSVVGLDPTDKLVPAPVMDAYAVEAEERQACDGAGRRDEVHIDLAGLVNRVHGELAGAAAT